VDASLRNCDGLLLHYFVDCHSINIVHLVKLVNAHDATVSEHHRAGFEMPVVGVLVDCNSRRQTDTRRATTCRIDCKRSDVHDVAEQLTLGSGRVTDHHDVDVTSQMRPVRKVFLNTTKELEKQ